MKSKHLTILSATTALALVSFGDAAWADGGCSSAMLKGSYAFSAIGEVIGLLDDNGVHPFATPSVLNDVAILHFDGVSLFTRTDFGNINGVPKGPDWSIIRSLFRFGLPAGVQGVAMNVAGVILLRFIGSLEHSA